MSHHPCSLCGTIHFHPTPCMRLPSVSVSEVLPLPKRLEQIGPDIYEVGVLPRVPWLSYSGNMGRMAELVRRYNDFTNLHDALDRREARISDLERRHDALVKAAMRLYAACGQGLAYTPNKGETSSDAAKKNRELIDAEVELREALRGEKVR